MLKRREVLAVLAAAGILWGGAQLVSAADNVPPAVAERIAEAKARLKLTPEQEAKLRPIVEERNQKLKAIHDKQAGDTSRSAKREMFREAKPVQEDYDTKVRAILTDEQETEWQAMRKEAWQRMREQYRAGRSPE